MSCGGSALARLESSGTMTAILWNFHLGAERQPYLSRRDPLRQGRLRRAPSDRVQNEICDEEGPSGAELVVDGAKKLTAAHGSLRTQ
jgi:hypothetical protein